MKVADFFTLLKDAAIAFWNDKAPRLGAALAFYTSLSISPLLLIVVGIAGLVFGREAAQGALFDQLNDLIGEEGARVIETMLAQSSEPSQGVWATTLGLATLLLGATGVFAQLQDALNTVWKTESIPQSEAHDGWMRTIWNTLRDRFLSFSMVCGMGFLLLVSLILSALLQAMRGYFLDELLSSHIVVQGVDFAVSLLLTLLLFAFIFRYLPAASIAWSDVWIGAGLTAVLFSVGKILIGLYLGNAAVGSTFGAAGSFVVLLLWIYYSTQIVLFGAEFARLYATRFGSGLRPRDEGILDAQAYDGREVGARRHAVPAGS